MNNTTTNQQCTVFYGGEWKRGEYTGYSNLTQKHHISLYNGETVKLSSLSGVKFDTTPYQPTKFETGATSHAVNELILFIDTTNKMAQRRDEIYRKYIKPDPKLTDWFKSMKAEFEKVLLPSAMYQYRMELGEEPYQEICCNMCQDVYDEFSSIYAARFYSWKKDHGYK